ncbi:transglycosylase SLT domain-containing protein [uncultured Cohaesibacter sp.]|uniref:lytic transglycosylase domain-containing protein n=1 Tax=uncultured Cohaesibacter sp. TaxID=1002546 RepID=UPI002AAA9FB8|nr:transglycosylase SLT domain-containing protein [uncultured Cohaesibacter sp.]
MIRSIIKAATTGFCLVVMTPLASAQTLPESVPVPRSRPAIALTAPMALPEATPEPAPGLEQTGASAPQSTADLPANLVILPKNRTDPTMSPAPPAPTVGSGAALQLPVAAQQAAQPEASLPTVRSHDNGISAERGSLKDALNALEKNDQKKALAIQKGMKPSLDRTLLTYILIIGGYHNFPASEIKAFYDHNPQWPSRSLTQRRIEEAVARETETGAEMVRAFGNAIPESTTAAIELAISQAKVGNKAQAAKIIRPIWRESALDSKTESRILSNMRSVLTNEDHFHRASYLLYRDRANGALRLKRYLTDAQMKLVNARVAVIRRARNAGSLLRSVPSSLRKDPGYIFSEIQYTRRQGKETEAADLILKAPLDEDHLINHDAWWDERRLLARMMMNKGDARRAYKIAARHSAESGKDFSEAEFHAGFFALRYLHDEKTAAVHFENSWKKATRTQDKSRGLYWQGRAWEAAGDRAVAVKFYQAAANATNYYGQLSLEELGTKHLNLRTPPPANATQKAHFERRDLVRAIKRLKAVGQEDRAGPLFRHLARTLADPSEIELAHKLAQSYGLHQNAVQIGQLALNRDMPVDKLAFPLHALPMGVKTNGVDIALVYALTKQESVFDLKARSHANARGLMQMLPATAKRTARKLGVSYSLSRITSDPNYAVLLGSAFLKENLERFGGSYILTFAAYNAGPGRPPEWIERFGDPRTNEVSAIDWIERIPFSETRNYVMKLIENLQVYEARIHNETLDISKDLKRGHP